MAAVESMMSSVESCFLPLHLFAKTWRRKHFEETKAAGAQALSAEVVTAAPSGLR